MGHSGWLSSGATWVAVSQPASSGSSGELSVTAIASLCVGALTLARGQPPSASLFPSFVSPAGHLLTLRQEPRLFPPGWGSSSTRGERESTSSVSSFGGSVPEEDSFQRIMTLRPSEQHLERNRRLFWRVRGHEDTPPFPGRPRLFLPPKGSCGNPGRLG